MMLCKLVYHNDRYLCAFMCLRVCVSVYEQWCLCDCMFVRVGMRVCMYACMHVCTCVCLYVCVCVYVYIYIHIYAKIQNANKLNTRYTHVSHSKHKHQQTPRHIHRQKESIPGAARAAKRHTWRCIGWEKGRKKSQRRARARGYWT